MSRADGPTDAAYDVAIVGYGPVGATLANLCGVHGLKAVVLERSTAPYTFPRACHLDAEVMRVLQAIGLGAEAAAVCETSRGMEYVDVSGRRLFTYEDFRRPPVLGWEEDYVFVQPELEAVLRAGVERFGTVDVRLGTEVTGVDGVHTRRREGTVRLATTGGDIAARWVVACDGATSTIRRALRIPQRSLGFDEQWLVVDVMLRRRVALPGIIQQVCDPDRLVTFVPSAGAHRRWELQVRPGEDPDALRTPDAVWRLLAPWCSPADGELVRAAVYRFHAVVAERWRAGPVFLAGDAAHQMPPFMGQGMCSGIRDVANLAWKLALVARGEAGTELLGTYEEERIPHVERTVELSVEAGRVLHELAAATGSGRTAELPEPDTDDGERWSRLPPLTAGLLDGAPPYSFPVGHQARQPRVVHDGTPVLLDDLCGPGFALVARGPLPAEAVEVLARLAPVRFVDTACFGDPDGWVARLLAGRAAVLVRPDRYVFGVADHPAEVAALLARLHAALK